MADKRIKAELIGVMMFYESEVLFVPKCSKACLMGKFEDYYNRFVKHVQLLNSA